MMKERATNSSVLTAKCSSLNKFIDWLIDCLTEYLSWLKIVSWRARPGPLIARARASTRRCKSSDLVHSKILQDLYFDRKYLWKLTVKICKIWHSGKERAEISVLSERKNSVRSKQNKRENRIIWNFSESFLQNFFKIGSLVGFNVQNDFSKFEKIHRTIFTESRFFWF